MPRKIAKIEPPKPTTVKNGSVHADRAHPATVKRELRLLFRDAFDELGGMQWLVDFAREDAQNARTFVQALARLIPLELVGKDGQPLSITILKSDGSSTKVDLSPTAVIDQADGRVLN